ncbi:hypothetical protein N7445_009563 [Penicillium cf. griseofulvum]|nr:hypothetical protein N7445_009563 [Penicillium cf. griseofulvum]
MGLSGIFKVQALLVLLGTTTLILNSAFAASLPGNSSYVAAAGFPTSAFSSYYFSPAQPTRQPQPIIYDPVLDLTFPYGLTDPDNIPDNQDEVYFPAPRTHMPAKKRYKLVQEVVSNVTNIIQSNGTDNNCTRCQNALAAAKLAALHAPAFVPSAMIGLCKAFRFRADETCEQDYATNTFGAIWTQVLAYADVGGLDGQYICHSLGSYCSAPKTNPLDTTKLFPKLKFGDVQVPKANFHLDARYAVSSEASCTSSLCCRSDNSNDLSEDKPLLPASAYGSFQCDTPYDLGLAALQAVGPLTGTGKEKYDEHFAWTLYTGDLVSHDPASQISKALTQYTETSIYGMFKHYLSGPVFAALGDHDTSPANIDSPHNLPGRLGEQQSWNYEHGGYSVKTHYGLRIIAFNTDFWYRQNFLNFINTTDPDNSGIFSWIIEELQKAEDAGERVWIIGHVLSGWDGSNALPNPTDIFYQIDEFMVYYANNGTVQNADNALTTGWIMPSITPMTNLNSGFRMYEVDTGDFNIYEAYTFYSNVSDYPALEHTGPTFEIEYSTRDAFGLAAGWDEDAPLNATFWHRVTEAMENDVELISLHNTYQGKQSVKSPECNTAECQKAKVCYMRNSSFALGSQYPQGYGSVQGSF